MIVPMLPHKLFLSLFVTLFLSLATAGQNASSTLEAGRDEADIRAVMDKSMIDWNRGDLEAFATSYKNSPGILFIGNRVSRGYAAMLERYRKNYPTPEARGTLTFTNLEVHSLDSRFATVIGNCHLERAPVGGGSLDCIFSLVFEKTTVGWKIVLDHSSPVTVAGKAPSGN